MADKAEIEILLKTTGADKAVEDLKKVEQAEKEVASADGGGFSGQLDGTTKVGRQAEESLTRAVTTAQNELNGALSIGKEHSIFMVKTKEMELQMTQDLATATERMAGKAGSLGGIAKLAGDAPAVISSLKGIAAEATAIAGPIAIAYSIGTLGARAMVNAGKENVDWLVKQDKAFAESTFSNRQWLDSLTGNFTALKTGLGEMFSGMKTKVADFFDTWVLNGYITEGKLTRQAWQRVADTKAALEAMREANRQLHADLIADGKQAMETMIANDNAYINARLAGQAQVKAAMDELAVGREQRAGASPGEQAASGVTRQQQNNQVAEQTQEALVQQANAHMLDLLAKAQEAKAREREAMVAATEGNTDALRSKAEQASQRAREASAAFEAAEGNAQIAEQRLSTLRDTNAAKMQNSVEATLKTQADSIKGIIDAAVASGTPLDGAFQVAKQSIDKAYSNQKINLDDLQNIDKAAQQLAMSSSVAPQAKENLLKTVKLMEGFNEIAHGLTARLTLVEANQQAIMQRQ